MGSEMCIRDSITLVKTKRTCLDKVGDPPKARLTKSQLTQLRLFSCLSSVYFRMLLYTNLLLLTDLFAATSARTWPSFFRVLCVLLDGFSEGVQEALDLRWFILFRWSSGGHCHDGENAKGQNDDFHLEGW